jgi:hypothetical protein
MSFPDPRRSIYSFSPDRPARDSVMVWHFSSVDWTWLIPRTGCSPIFRPFAFLDSVIVVLRPLLATSARQRKRTISPAPLIRSLVQRRSLCVSDHNAGRNLTPG